MLKRMACLAVSLVFAVSLAPGIALADDVYAADSGAFLDREVLDLDAQALAKADYSWYTGHEADGSYTLSTANQIIALANLVNGTDGQTATTFEGKTVSLKGNATFNFLAQEWTPIGDADHPFLGAFDGAGSVVDNFSISGNDRAAYLGFFGYVGTGGSIANLSVGSNADVSASRDKSSTDVLHHIGSVAGFCGGTITNCSNAAKITLSSDVVQTDDNHQVIYAVGGIVGECAFDLTGCTNRGAITLTATSDPVGSVDDSGIIRYVGGVVGMLGDLTRIGSSDDGAIAADPTKHGSIDGCLNTAKLTIDTTSEAGLDRFGMTTYARSIGVGGIAGYSQGSITNCINGSLTVNNGTASDVGYIRAEHGTSVGGIVGSLRGLIDSDNPSQRAEEDDGMAGGGKDPLVMSNCTNYGDVYAFNAAGGILGFAGTYTTVKGCTNSNKKTAIGSNEMTTWIVATRWNKPSPAGIAGSTCGDVAFCANLGTIASGSWVDESKRTYKTAAGYYVAGIAGMLSYYEKMDETTMTLVRQSPLPQVYGCYNAGGILADSGMRQRGIVGENEGHVHDCLLLAGTVENDKVAYGNEAGDTEAAGTVANCWVLTSDELRAADASGLANAACTSQDWSDGLYWVKPASSGVEANKGYPVFSTSSTSPSNPTDISSGSATCTQNAYYSGGVDGWEALPTMQVKLGSTTLKPNIDYYVKPQAGAAELGEGYLATIVGIGAYTGSIQNVPYGIGLGYLSECIMTVEGTTYNFEAQYPDLSDITVRTSNGTIVDQSEYEIAGIVDSKGNETTEPTNRGNYTVTVKVKENSTHFDTTENNTVSGRYRISPGDIMKDVDFDKVTVTLDGKTYPWVSASDEENVDDPTTTFAYTGSPIKPTISNVTYNGHMLTEGVDYRIVYGNPNPENGDTTSKDTNNVGVAGGTSIGCVTIRYVTNSNFTNYENMFFWIVDESAPTQEMYRLYNPNSGEHFYTADAEERDFLDSIGWVYEGVGWTAPKNSNTPVYRLYNPYAGEHHYTTNASERDGLVKTGWKDEGIGWYSDDAQGTPLYRQYNPNAFSCNHNYTTSKDENDWLVSLGWKAEGIGWYGVAAS